MPVKDKDKEITASETDRGRKGRAKSRTESHADEIKTSSVSFVEVDALFHRLDEGIARAHADIDGLLERMGTHAARFEPSTAMTSGKVTAASVSDPDFDALLHRLDEGIARQHAAMDRLLERMASRLPR